MLQHLVFCLALSAAPEVDAQHPHLFRYTQGSPKQFSGGSLHGANDDVWPILKDQNGSVYIAHLEKGALREPHWHPDAWELNYVIAGTAHWSVLGPQGSTDSFVAQTGDLVFVPRGHLHYFENTDSPDLRVLVIFNTSAQEPRDDIGIAASLAAVPPEVLSAVLGVDAEAIRKVQPQKAQPVVIVKRRKP